MSIEREMTCRNPNCEMRGISRSIPLSDPDMVSVIAKIKNGSLEDDDKHAAIKAVFEGRVCAVCGEPLEFV